MKKLLILIFTILSLSSYGQTRLDLVNVGSGPGQGDGDPLRTAFIKTNSAINALDSLYGPGTAYIKFKGSTSGTIRIEAEAVAGTNKLTAPAETGTLATQANVTDQVNDSLNAVRAGATYALKLYLDINAQTGTSYTLVLADVGKLITLSNAAAITLTVPPNSSAAFPTGTQITITQTGAGQVTVAEGSGVTVNSADAALGLRAQYSTATLIKTATDTWLLIGDIE